MDGIVVKLMGLIAGLASVYSLLIVIRIILTWFGNINYGKPVQILIRITDPYLDWWRQKLNLRAGNLDLSPIIAIAVLSVVQTICSIIAKQGGISLGVIAAVCLFAIWSVVSFILGFYFIVLVLRFIAYMVNANMFTIFWQTIDSISKPLLYRISRIIFGKRIVRFTVSILASMGVLAGLWLAGRLTVQFITNLLGLKV
ncbi:MAG: YggT family protein [Treponema sp.]|jgi:YggT family protein|nr:YggT family protein [Treponema sp.]